MTIAFMPWDPRWNLIESTVFMAWPVQFLSWSTPPFSVIAIEARARGVIIGEIESSAYMRPIRLERVP